VSKLRSGCRDAKRKQKVGARNLGARWEESVGTYPRIFGGRASAGDEAHRAAVRKNKEENGND
jgi:hypothetical protein